MKRKILSAGADILIAELLVACAAIGLSAEPPVRTVVSDDRPATCYDEKTGIFRGSMAVRSRVLVAPDGEHRAYAESLAAGVVKLPAKTTGSWLSPECASISQLLAADGHLSEFTRVLTIAPAEDTLGNVIKLIDWSPDSHYLLLQVALFQWGSDFGGSDPVIYDARTGTLSDPALPYRAFKRRAGRDCVASIEPLGFSSEDKIVLRAGPLHAVAPESSEPESSSCLKKPGIWLYDPETGSVAELPSDYRVRHFGQVERDAARK